MIKYSETKRGDILKLSEEGKGAPGYAEKGDLLRVTEANKNSVKVEDRNGEPCEFCFECGVARLDSTEWRDDFPSDD